jgi:predicted amidohydrolase
MSKLEVLFEQMEYFIDAVSDYSCDFCLFPEFFNAPLMAKYNELPESEAIRKLAEYTESIKLKFQEFAISYNINIITGSMPFIENEHLYNVGYLCRRDGSIEEFRKIHITPSESYAWGMVGGNLLQTFDTDCGKIGILICYDSECPELSRILAEEGMNILFVPFLTDTQNGFHRVKRCAQARAIENECYVAISGCVGYLPEISAIEFQYGESAIFTPSDYAFPQGAIKSQLPANVESIIVSDVDLELLHNLHHRGSVRNLQDRRHDLYQVKANDKLKMPLSLDLEKTLNNQ